MSNSEHPWLNGRFDGAQSFSAPERICTFLAANTARGDCDGVRLDWRHLPAQHHTAGLEAILQTHLFAGYPRTINALAAVRDVGVDPSASNGHGETPYEDWLPSGKTLCAQLYGKTYDRLRDHMQSLHPAIERWMLETGYGRVLSRPGLSPRQRELCVLAVLSGQNVPKQLESHLRGALRVGATHDECEAVLSQTKALWGNDAAVQSQKIWNSL